MTKKEMMSKIADLVEECPTTGAIECNRCPLIHFCVGYLTGDWGDYYIKTASEKESRE